MESHNVIITAIGTNTSMSVLKALREDRSLNVRIIGTDCDEEKWVAGAKYCDAFYRVPKATEAGYIDRLLEVCQKEAPFAGNRRQVLIPISDQELLEVATYKDDFEDINVLPLVSSARTVEVCNDKLKTFKAFESFNIPTPHTGEWRPGTLIDGVDFPVIVKPRFGVSSIGVNVAYNMEDVRVFVRRAEQPLLQQYLEGEEYTIDTLCDLDGKFVDALPRQRIVTKAGICTKGISVLKSDLINYAALIATSLDIIGHCNIQCIVTKDGPKFFEINPRFSGTLVLSVKAGLNSPSYLVKKAIGIEPPKMHLQGGVIMTRYWNEVFN